ncbi:hypothetical protein VPH35_093926 [Triticum aestivum]|uniref:Uncharacterized protein n=1 Tax=Triticum turgidum subsp. durum TaxID=4567 RepID=A0A9R1ATB4_TRITD|nr:unnamed protein product [Triticum turgidum subsp. durum]
MMATYSRASHRSLLNGKPVGTIESHPDQESPGITRPWEFAGGDFRNLTLQPDQGGQASGRSSSCHLRYPRIAAFIQAEPAAPTPSVGTLHNLPYHIDQRPWVSSWTGGDSAGATLHRIRP